MSEYKVETREIPTEDYIALLESNFQAHAKINELERTLRAEYQFAEDKIKKIKELETKLSTLESFIASDNSLKINLYNYKENHNLVEDEGVPSGGFDDHE